MSHAIKIIDHGNAIAITWPNGAENRFHSFWLLENGQDESRKDISSGQKRKSITEVSLSCKVAHAVIEENKVFLDFIDGAATWLALPWLRQHSYDSKLQTSLLNVETLTWGKELDINSCSDHWDNINSDSNALLAWLENIHSYGFAHLSGLPDQPGALHKLVALFGYIRETNYGALFEVKSKPKAINLAYTALGLDPHTDNPYRDPVPTLQLLHCLENDTEGGESIIVDGFLSAKTLHIENPDAFDLLARYNATFQYQGDGNSYLTANRPMIELSPDGQIIAVRINNRSCQGITAVPYEKMRDYYTAYQALVEITKRSSSKASFRLRSGEMFVVDNTRVLHGRNGFTATGPRWFQGAYADKDSLMSTIHSLRHSLNSI